MQRRTQTPNPNPNPNPSPNPESNPSPSPSPSPNPNLTLTLAKARAEAAEGELRRWREAWCEAGSREEAPPEAERQRVAAARQGLAEAYSNWTRTMRQYLTTLKAHGLDVVFHHPEDGSVLDGSFFREPGFDKPGTRWTAITEHSFGDLGVIAVTLAEDDEVINYYPLSAPGLNDLHADIRTRVHAGHTVSFPGTLLYDENQRRLLADLRMPSTDD